MAMGMPHPHHRPALAARAALALLAVAAAALVPAPAARAGAGASGSGFPPGMFRSLLDAEFAVRRGGGENAARAARLYLDAARAHPDPDLAERAARIAIEGGGYGLAAEAAGRWRELDPERLEAWRMRAFALVRTRRPDEAAAALRDLARRWDEPPGHGYELAAAEVLDGEPDPERRVGLMERVADETPGARFALARVLVRSGQGERGAEVLEALRREAPHEDRYAIALALLVYAREDLDTALALLAGQEARHGDAAADGADGGASDALLRTHARLLEAGGRPQEALERYETLLARGPGGGGGDVRYSLARLLMELERFGEARTHFERLRHRAEWRDTAWFHIGWTHEALDEPEPALRAYRRVRGGEWFLSASIRAAGVLAGLDRLDQARGYLTTVRALTEEDGDIQLYRAEGELLVRADRAPEAMDVLGAALAAHPGEAELLYARAMTAISVDRLDILEEDLRAILARDPNHADALNALGYTLADRTDRYEEAHELVKRALALRPDQYHIVDSMGWVLYRLGRHEEAADYLRRSYEMEPHPEVAAHLGEVLWVLGRREEARRIWDAALARDPDDEVLVETLGRFGT